MTTVQDRFLRDGIYQVPHNTVIVKLEDERGNSVPSRRDASDIGWTAPDTKLVELILEKFPALKQYIEGNDDWCLASAYETDCCLFLSKRPEEYTGNFVGEGFNYGCTAYLSPPPDGYGILIQAEND